MEQVYEQNLWGGKKGSFYSGEGSHNPLIVEPYVKVIIKFLQSFDKPLTVCDLGCGDFNIGNQLYEFSKSYVGVDVVEALIEENKKAFTAPNLTFKVLDISKADLPKADCVFIRQVLQHLSNNEIQTILDKLKDYKYAIITEHIPHGEFKSNVDKVASLGIRLSKGSGVDITKSPFQFKIKSKEELLSVNSVNWKGRIVTTLFEI